MAIIRLQDNVPDVYVNNSRDFQLLCQIYDCVINGVKFDIDTITNIIDTSKCKESFMPLLSRKVGYVDPKTGISNSTLRLMNDSWPYIVRKKGSLSAIQEAINVFMKVKHIKASVDIVIVNNN